MPEVLELIRVPGFLYFSTSLKMLVLISSRSTTTSMIQSQAEISFILSVKFPVLMRFTTSLLYTGEGFDLIAARQRFIYYTVFNSRIIQRKFLRLFCSI